MKKTISANSVIKFLYLFLLITFIAACRKGPEDPILSLRSRKARLVGKWKLTGGRDSILSGSTYSFNDYSPTSLTNYSIGGGNINVTTYEEIWTFNRNSTFTLYIKKEYTPTRKEEQNIEGTWDFNSGLGNEKKKEKVLLNITRGTEITTLDTSTTTVIYNYTTNIELISLDLLRLSNSELKIYELRNVVGLSSSSDFTSSRKTFKSIK